MDTINPSLDLQGSMDLFLGIADVLNIRNIPIMLA